MKRLVLLLSLMLAAVPAVQAQDYDVPEVVVSTEKANIGGKVYYVHKVLAKQTVFSICKAYGVTRENLETANPEVKDGLKAGMILFIPVNPSAAAPAPAAKVEKEKEAEAEVRVVETEAKAVEEEEKEEVAEQQGAVPGGRVVAKVIEHRVRWYESIQSIARKYDITVAELMAYNGLRESDSIRGKVLLIPVMGEAALPEQAESEEEDEETESRHGRTPAMANRYFSAAEPLHVALVLPFNASSAQASAPFLNFYCGALMAIQEQKEKGAYLDVQVFDLAQGADHILSDPLFERSELIIGPVEASTLEAFASFADEHSAVIVSPLDHKADALTSAHPYFFQAPAPADVQLDNLVMALRRNTEPIVLVVGLSEEDKQMAAEMEDLLRNVGIPYRKVTTTDIPELSPVRSGSHMRVLIGSEGKAFATEAISALNTLSKSHIPIEVWCTNRVRNYEMSDPDALFNLSAHTSVPYFVDYSNPADQAFVVRYRALFSAEPDDFAFQGHDVLSYFISSMMQQGTSFARNADRHPAEMLHCNFDFKRDDEKSGWRNHATRLLVYDKDDFSIRVVK